jgi:hypothetical protein
LGIQLRFSFVCTRGRPQPQHARRAVFLGRVQRRSKRLAVYLSFGKVQYPPYHSKYNPNERCWSALEKKWNGVLLNCLKVVLRCALRMKWKGRHPTVKHLDGE